MDFLKGLPELNNSIKYWDTLKKIKQGLFKSPIIANQKYFEFSTNIPNGDLNYIFKYSEEENRKSDFFELYSSVAILPVGEKDWAYIFKSLGRTPWELRLICSPDTIIPIFHPCKVYWEGKCFDNFPDLLVKEYPRIYGSYFWNNLNLVKGVEEIPMGLITSERIYSKKISNVRKILKELKVFPDKRRRNKASIPFTEGCRIFAIKKYQSLCKKDFKYRKRYPIKQIQEHLDSKAGMISGDEHRCLPDDSTIWRWLDDYNRDLEEKRSDLIARKELDALRQERKKRIKEGYVHVSKEDKFVEGIPINSLDPK